LRLQHRRCDLPEKIPSAVLTRNTRRYRLPPVDAITLTGVKVMGGAITTEPEQFNSRICPDLAYRAKVQAAKERRRVGLLVQDALSLYLAKIGRAQKRAAKNAKRGK
jgi:hypothetical protein